MKSTSALVLACAAVIADPGARFGQPEINLNLLPGYGGTQRLPRRLHQRRGRDGLVDAVRLIASGRNIDAEEAAEAGDVITGEGEPGEIQVRGPAVFGEYWNRPWRYAWSDRRTRWVPSASSGTPSTDAQISPGTMFATPGPAAPATAARHPTGPRLSGSGLDR